MGLGYTASCLKDEWSIFNNTAGLADIKKATAGFTYRLHPSFRFFNRPAFALALPTKIGVTGIGLSHIGDDIFNERIASLGIANTFGLASLGVKLNVIQISAEGFGTQRLVTANFGGQAALTKQLTIGAHITNINGAKMSNEVDAEKLPSYLTIGIGIKPSEKLILTAEIEKDLIEAAIFRSGFEYRFLPKFLMRSGFSFNPDAGFIGLGSKGKRFAFDYGLQYNTRTGLSYEVTTSLKLSRR